MVFSPVSEMGFKGRKMIRGLMRISTGMRALSQSLILTEANRTSSESFLPEFETAFMAKAVAVLRLDLADSDSYQILFKPPLACNENGVSEQK